MLYLHLYHEMFVEWTNLERVNFWLIKSQNITVKYSSSHYKTEYIKQLYRLFAIRSEDIPARLCQTNVLQNFRRDETDSQPADNVAVASSCIQKEPVENRRYLARSFRA